MFQSNSMKNNMSSILGPEVEISGDVKVTGDLLIYGKVYGNISGDQLIIEEGGIYKGKVNMDVISSKNSYEGEFQLNRS